MRDMGHSDDPRVQAQLDRLSTMSIQREELGLDAIRELMRRLDDPHTRLPPVFHVAGTNGKGSTCAFLRAMLAAEGYRVHVTTSPHLVRYNERFRVAGKLIADDRLAPLLEEVFDAAEGLGCSFFEITIAAAFLEFSRVPADACVVEVGLGGRLDATNVLEPESLAACGIAALGIDHEKFLLAPQAYAPRAPLARIAWEKAGIAKEGVPLVTLGNLYAPLARPSIRQVAEPIGARLFQLGRDWDVSGEHIFRYEDARSWQGFTDGTAREPDLRLPPPSLLGEFQRINAGLAVAMLRHQSKVRVSEASIAAGIASAVWPARTQRLSDGPLTALTSSPVWLDGGHNASAGEAICAHFDAPLHLIIGMLEAKDPQAIVAPLGDRVRSITAVPIKGYDCHPASAFDPEARAAQSVEDALLALPSDDFPVLIAGSLYLAGEVLRANDEVPD